MKNLFKKWRFYAGAAALLLVITGILGTSCGNDKDSTESAADSGSAAGVVSIFTGDAEEAKVDVSKRTGGAEGLTLTGKEDPDHKFVMKKATRPIVPIKKQDIYGNPLPEECYVYRNMLSANEKKAYDQIYSNVLAGDPSFSLPVPIHTSRILELLSAVYYDNPDLFWLDNGINYSYDSSGNITNVTVSFGKGMNEGNIAQYKKRFDDCADSVLEKAGKLGSDAEKVKFIHDFLININTYEFADYHQSAYGAIVQGKSVCNGYAMAFTYFMQRLGIPAAAVIGTAGGGNHAWSTVKLDGEWYAMDVTWDDPDTPGKYNYEYFNITEAKISRDHKRGHSQIALSVNLPQATGTAYTYAQYFSGKPGSNFSGIKYGGPSTALIPLVGSNPNAIALAGGGATGGGQAGGGGSPADDGGSTPAGGGGSVPLTIVNRTGSGITEVYISGSDVNEWGDNLLAGSFANGASKRFVLDGDSGFYDIAVGDRNGAFYYKYSIEPSQQNRIEISAADLSDEEDSGGMADEEEEIMEIILVNNTNRPLFAAVVFGEDNGNGPQLYKHGWWEVGAHSSKTLTFTNVYNLIGGFGYYASQINDRGVAVSWNGSNNNPGSAGIYYITDDAFNGPVYESYGNQYTANFTRFNIQGGGRITGTYTINLNK